MGVLSCEDRTIEFTRALAEESVQRKAVEYDRTGDAHYDSTSALIKSMRGSDPDAALYWMTRMLEAGEDPLFVARRMVIFAAEDVGNADPRALQLAIAVKDAVDFVGMPEGAIPLAQGVTYLACAPKSNASYRGMLKARADAVGLFPATDTPTEFATFIQHEAARWPEVVKRSGLHFD